MIWSKPLKFIIPIHLYFEWADQYIFNETINYFDNIKQMIICKNPGAYTGWKKGFP